MSLVYISGPIRAEVPANNDLAVEVMSPLYPVAVPSGPQGIPGVSPTVEVTDITGGHRVTITSAGGTVSFDVLDGEKGEQGDPGTPGTPGPPGVDGVGVPTGGTTGQVLKKKSNVNFDTEWQNEGGAVDSVNGKTGAVVLDAADVGALPADTTYVSSVNGSSGAVTVTVPQAATAIPADLGTAAAGTSAKYAREDHVHNLPSSLSGLDFQIFEVSSSATKTVTFANYSSAVIFTAGRLSGRCMTVNVYCGNTGSVYYTSSTTSDKITLSTGTNTFTITNSTQGSAYCLMIVYTGSATVS